METMVTLLICLPFALAAIIALSMKFLPTTKLRNGMGYLCAGIVIVLSCVVAFSWLFGARQTIAFDLPGSEIFDSIILVGDFVLMALVVYLTFKYRKYWIALISVVQTLLVAGLEIFEEELGITIAEAPRMRMDYLAFFMILVIGVIGGAICIYAVGYMHGYHHYHMKKIADRRYYFFSIIFIFYGAMFGLVTSASIIWIYFFWEITSICSFLLIGYTREEIAINNSFKALWMNLLGGLGIAIAIAVGMICFGTTDLYTIIGNAMGATNGSLALVPIAMLAFASFTKSAQFPFSGWLLGAMVAPTPSSALLHSATMVKAGIYMLIRISVAMGGNYVGQMVFLIGGFTFFATSCLAIAQQDGKKVLAYSTVSNLGLIVACTGAGHEETIWAAIFLLLFHAVSKSMLFQCVGAIENTTESRNIETMTGLAVKYPKLGAILMMGIAGMFLAPFGMLVSKWAALKAFVDINSGASIIMILFICFGSATTMFYWTKWLAKILGVDETAVHPDRTKPNEYISMFFHAVLLIALCIGMPFLSDGIVTDAVQEMFGTSQKVMSDSNIIIMAIMIFAVFIVPFVSYLISKSFDYKKTLGYMGGANAGDNKNFVDSFGEPKELHISSWYLEGIFSEAKIFTPSVIVGALIIVVHIILVVGGAM
ncbi:MAG: NADH-quinone oxidoreductase subunit L [Pseudobutyrivibrio sp.]|nr:NADH-quinone oxidoreductase subunit L [Pseudobutyrivibrio sp.]